MLIAGFILAIALIPIVGSIDSSTQLTLGAQAREQLSAYGQRELERLRTTAYADLGLATLPSSAPAGNAPDDSQPNNPHNPNYYVNGGQFRVMADYSNKLSGPAAGVASAGEELVSGGTVTPGPDTASVGGISILVHRYVTWRDDPGCPSCTGTHDTKRITVAVAPVATSGQATRNVRPMYFSTVVAP